MGMMNVVGTIGSGWLTDRYDNRKLLAGYYVFRAISLAMLPFIIDIQGLYMFAFIYGLDWIATVPPTTNLIASTYGRGSLGTIYGWVWFSHMTGAAIAAYIGGVFREILGDYHLVFLSAALLGFVAAAMTVRMTPNKITRAPKLAPSPARA
jgi:MFS family permease